MKCNTFVYMYRFVTYINSSTIGNGWLSAPSAEGNTLDGRITITRIIIIFHTKEHIAQLLRRRLLGFSLYKLANIPWLQSLSSGMPSEMEKIFV